ncbi:hypothetical protein C5Y96_02915 [Blastopirellula marina]|uniref:Uncharacterized protein n=1 Tax=Blastopirellula marina TaxID=124 RepID=A0A2S8G330_9BACT|nr:hypothetical protein C5Y96_02915 [Blastopirellula marina]RCS55145.1 hypothetical protein DTL36_02920 [Bremerella cremea]
MGRDGAKFVKKGPVAYAAGLTLLLVKLPVGIASGMSDRKSCKHAETAVVVPASESHFACGDSLSSELPGGEK